MQKTILACFLFLTFFTVQSQVLDTLPSQKPSQRYTLKNGDLYIYNKPKLFDFITKLPKSVIGTIKDASQTDNLIALGASGVVTVALLPADQYLLDQSRQIGRKLGMADVARYKSFGPLSNIPPNATSAIYLIGNGTTPVLLCIGFTTYGLLNNDYRSLHTASGLMEGLLITGVFSQTIKRISGRQSPTPALEQGNPGGEWHPFPSFGAFAKNTPNYDAFPSGHLMTATASLYVIAGNYPDKKWIKPVGFTLIGLLSFQMVQSSVHWVSDYPISLVMGYIIGKNIVKNSASITKSDITETKKYSYHFTASQKWGYNLIGGSVTF